MYLYLAAALAAAYLIGSLPTAYILGKLAKGIDIREHGSGNVGATNALRVLGKKLGVFCLVVDLLKGVAGVYAAAWILGRGVATMSVVYDTASNSSAGQIQSALNVAVLTWGTAASGLATILGHIFTIWLKFRGGKGVASTVGVFLALQPLALITTAVIGVTVIWRTRFVALGSLVIAWLLPILSVVFGAVFAGENDSWFRDAAPSMTLGILLGLMITWSHRGNIKRLLSGTERRLGDPVGTAAEETGAKQPVAK